MRSVCVFVCMCVGRRGERNGGRREREREGLERHEERLRERKVMKSYFSWQPKEAKVVRRDTTVAMVKRLV